jgi:hypothetical protein
LVPIIPKSRHSAAEQNELLLIGWAIPISPGGGIYNHSHFVLIFHVYGSGWRNNQHSMFAFGKH